MRTYLDGFGSAIACRVQPGRVWCWPVVDVPWCNCALVSLMMSTYLLFYIVMICLILFRTLANPPAGAVSIVRSVPQIHHYSTCSTCMTACIYTGIYAYIYIYIRTAGRALHAYVLSTGRRNARDEHKNAHMQWIRWMNARIHGHATIPEYVCTDACTQIMIHVINDRMSADMLNYGATAYACMQYMRCICNQASARA